MGCIHTPAAYMNKSIIQASLWQPAKHAFGHSCARLADE